MSSMKSKKEDIEGTSRRKSTTSRFWKFSSRLSTRTFNCMTYRENPASCSSLHLELEEKAKTDGAESSDYEEDEDQQTVDRLELSEMSIPQVPNCLRSHDSLISTTTFSSVGQTQMYKDKTRVSHKLKRKTTVAFEGDGNPPAGFLWIWMGVLRRWHRNYFLLETPGVLTHSRHKGSQMKGAFCLRDARVIASQGHSRQFCIVSPAGVAYLRSVKKDQRGAWISHIRQSIEKYTQCVQQAERVSSVQGSLVYVEPEQAKLALEVNNRTRARMTELEPYKESLRRYLNQAAKRVNAVQELFCDTSETESVVRRTSARPSTRTTEAASRKALSPTVYSRENTGVSPMRLDRDRLKRQSSLRDEFTNATTPLQRQSSKTDGQRRLSTVRSSNLSADDLLLSASAPMDVLAEGSARISKSLTPRPSDTRRRSHVQYSQATSPAPAETVQASEPSLKQEARSSTLQRVSELGSPFLRPSESRIPVGTNLWSSYYSFIKAVQNTLQKEAQYAMELKAENSALRKLLQSRRTDTDGNEDVPCQLISGSTSRSYSTAESELDVSLLENSDDDPDSFETSMSRGSHSLEDITEEDKQSKEEILDALEVVRRADYVTRNSAKSVGLVVNLRNALLPKPYEDDDEDSESQPENEDLSELNTVGVARTRLPAPQPIQRGFSVWNILKNAIGRDLTRITMPATINEPLSALQRLVEDFEHYDFLRKAASCSCPDERLLYVSAFVLSSYNAGLLRDCKPFNPLLGETFEWSNEHIQFLGEQVSHHPPVSCFHVNGFDTYGTGEKIYEVQGELELRSKFWGTSVSVFPTGRMELFLTTTNEHYVWNKASISIHNLVLGQLWLDFHGEILVRNQTTGGHAKLRISKARGSQLDRGNVEGKIFNRAGDEVYCLDGNFTSSIYAQKIITTTNGSKTMKYCDKEEIYQAEELPSEAADQYNMTPFGVGLNHLHNSQRKVLPKTDSRFRPDVRALEDGNVKFATSEKLRLEEKQRQARKARKGNGQKYMPMWFSSRHPHDKEHVRLVESDEASVWQFREEYWIRKDNKNWTGCPDIY